MANGTASGKHVTVFAENMAEATTACLFAMVQGNLFAIGLSHWLIASQTGLLASVIAGVGLVLTKTAPRWMPFFMLGLATVLADLVVHYFASETLTLESVVTGIVAVVLSILASVVLGKRRRRGQAVLHRSSREHSGE